MGFLGIVHIGLGNGTGILMPREESTCDGAAPGVSSLNPPFSTMAPFKNQLTLRGKIF